MQRELHGPSLDELYGEGAPVYQGSASFELPQARRFRFGVHDESALERAVRAELGVLEWDEPPGSDVDNQELIATCVAHVAARITPLGIFVPTETGATVRRIAAFRLPVWITAVSRSAKTCQELQFVYGVEPIHQAESPASWAEFARGHFQDRGRVLLTEGKTGPSGGANRFEILTL